MYRMLTLAAISWVAATLAQPASAEGQTHRIDMKGVAFAPAQVTVHVGDTVQWDNSDIVAHTATSKDGGFDVNVLPNRSGITVVKRPGSFNYTCRYHPNMKGVLLVEP